MGLLRLNHIITENEVLNHGYLLRVANTWIGKPFDAAFEAFARMCTVKIPSHRRVVGIQDSLTAARPRGILQASNKVFRYRVGV